MDCGQVQLALVLAEAGSRFVVVGGTARFLRTDQRRPRDLDLVVRPVDERVLDAAFAALGVAQRRPRLTELSPRRVLTSWSSVDVFVEDQLPAWSEVVVDGVGLRVGDG